MPEEDQESGVGAAAARVVTLAARVTEEAARSAVDTWGEVGGAIAQAQSLRQRAGRLARENARVHAAARDALAGVRERAGVEEAGAAPLAPALAGAADLPLEIAETAADTAALAALVAEHANPDARPDAAGAALLAAGAVSVAAHLVEANLAVLAGDKRATRAQELTALAEDACRRALAATD